MGQLQDNFVHNTIKYLIKQKVLYMLQQLYTQVGEGSDKCFRIKLAQSLQAHISK